MCRHQSWMSLGGCVLSTLSLTTCYAARTCTPFAAVNHADQRCATAVVEGCMLSPAHQWQWRQGGGGVAQKGLHRKIGRMSEAGWVSQQRCSMDELVVGCGWVRSRNMCRQPSWVVQAACLTACCTRPTCYAACTCAGQECGCSTRCTGICHYCCEGGTRLLAIPTTSLPPITTPPLKSC